MTLFLWSHYLQVAIKVGRALPRLHRGGAGVARVLCGRIETPLNIQWSPWPSPPGLAICKNRYSTILDTFFNTLFEGLFQEVSGIVQNPKATRM